MVAEALTLTSNKVERNVSQSIGSNCEPPWSVHVCHVAGQAVRLRAACVPLELTQAAGGGLQRQVAGSVVCRRQAKLNWRRMRAQKMVRWSARPRRWRFSRACEALMRKGVPLTRTKGNPRGEMRSSGSVGKGHFTML